MSRHNAVSTFSFASFADPSCKNIMRRTGVGKILGFQPRGTGNKNLELMRNGEDTRRISEGTISEKYPQAHVRRPAIRHANKHCQSEKKSLLYQLVDGDLGATTNRHIKYPAICTLYLSMLFLRRQRHLVICFWSIANCH